MAFLAALTPYLTFLAGAGSGMIASHLFDALQAQVVRWPAGTVRLIWWQRLLITATGDKRYAALCVTCLALLISGLATLILSYAAGTPLTEAWSAFIAFVAAQVWYALRRTFMPADGPPAAPYPH